MFTSCVFSIYICYSLYYMLTTRDNIRLLEVILKHLLTVVFLNTHNIIWAEYIPFGQRTQILYFSERCMATEGAADALVKSERVMWSKSVWEGQRWYDWDIPVIDQGELERKGASLFGHTLGGPLWGLLTWLLYEKGEKDIPVLTDNTVPLWLGSKELAESVNFQSLKQMMISADKLSENS